jgi:cell division inhibitor SepF
VRSITPAPPAPPAAPPATTGGAKPYTVAPSSFQEAQEVADHYMSGTPVILNLQGAERDLSRRLVDFASGLCYGLRGGMERVTTQVYLLTPSNVEVSAEDRRRLHAHAPV